VTLGVHLLIDADGCPHGRLSNPSLVRDALVSVPDKLSLTRVAPPQVTQEGDVIAGVVLISESHVSIHALPAEGRLLADVFSCRAFDAEAAVEALREIFGFERVRAEVVNRGERSEP
jgi:S-adenosylmethionine decarboxylase